MVRSAQLLGWHVEALEETTTPFKRLAEALTDADLFMWARTQGKAPKADMRDVWKLCTQLRVPAASLNMDLYLGMTHRDKRVGADPFWQAPHVFTCDGAPGTPHEKLFKDRGVNHHYCPPACGDEWIGRGKPRASMECDVAFTGTYMGASYRSHRGQLLQFLQKRYGSRFHRYGKGTPKGTIWLDDAADLYASAKIVIGDSVGEGTPGYWSDRVPVTMGKGGLLAHNYVLGMSELGIIPDHNMIGYRLYDFENLGAQLDKWISVDASERRAVTENAIATIRDQHSWSKRWTQIAEVML